MEQGPAMEMGKPAQFGLQVQAPDWRLRTGRVALVGQAAGDRVENLLGHQRPVEWALRLDRRGLGGGHAGGAEQRPQALLTG